MRLLIYIICLFSFLACSQETLFEDESRNDYWLQHEGASLPIVVEGNSNSRVFLLMIHGGPGSSAQEFNAGAKPLTDKLEKEYAVVYYDQRNSGLARGEWNEDKLTIEQHVEDLDQVIEFLYFKYGSDIKIFLSGHSWGVYLGQAYLLRADYQAKIEAFININGLTHRNFRNQHILDKLKGLGLEILSEQIDDNWSTLLADVNKELDKNIDTYDADSEDVVNSLKSRAASLISQAELLEYHSSSIGSSTYNDNYDPMLILVNSRKGKLIEQMYLFDKTVETSLASIEIPVLCVYGRYDVTTPSRQGTYLLSGISSLDEDKKIVILDKSAHSSMKNEPLLLAEEMINWIERYR